MIDDLVFSFACPLKWSDLSGNDAARTCWLCKRRVPDVSLMTTAEAQRFLRAQGGPRCARLRFDPQGRVLTRTSAIALSAGVLATLAVAEAQRDAVSDLAHDVKELVDPTPQPYMGVLF